METLNSCVVYENPWMLVREDTVRHPDGSTGIYGVVERADFAMIIPMADERVHLVDQYRYALGCRRWEFPAGTPPPGQVCSPDELAHRELGEETGLRADRMEYLGSLDASPGSTRQRGHVFLATGLTAGTPDPEPEEQDLTSAWFTRSVVEQMIADGEITDADTVAAYTLLLLSERGVTRRTPPQPRPPDPVPKPGDKSAGEGAG